MTTERYSLARVWLSENPTDTRATSAAARREALEAVTESVGKYSVRPVRPGDEASPWLIFTASAVVATRNTYGAAVRLARNLSRGNR